MTVAPSVFARPGEHRRIEADGAAPAQHVQQLRRGRARRRACRAARRAGRPAPRAAAATPPRRAGRRTARPAARRPGRAPSGTAGWRARTFSTARSHISYFAWTSSRCQRALRKLNTSTPCANTLISCDGLSTRQMLRLLPVAMRVRPVRRRARHVENHRADATRRGHVARDLDDVEHGAVAVDEEQRLDAVAEAVEALDAGQRRRILVGLPAGPRRRQSARAPSSSTSSTPEEIAWFS